MYAIGFEQSLDIDDPNVFIARKLSRPKPGPHELLIKVRASGINPVDTKMRQNYQQTGGFRVLGFDAAGDVVATGADVTNFSVNDQVYYSGVQTKQGSHAEYQVVNELLVGHAPINLNVAEAAAMPLTSLTAFEILHDAFGLSISKNIAAGKTVFIINGAGGVGSILIQLAKYLGMTVVTTASRLESVTWVKSLGADYILDYHQDLQNQLQQIKQDQVDYIAILQNTDLYWPLVVETIKPFGKIASIVETTEPLDMAPLKNIGAQFYWVFIFAKGNYGVDMATQGRALNEIAQLLDRGVINSTLKQSYKGLTIENLKQATQSIETEQTIGKIVITHEELI